MLPLINGRVLSGVSTQELSAYRSSFSLIDWYLQLVANQPQHGLRTGLKRKIQVPSV